MINSLYLKKLYEKARQNNSARWKLGEILYNASLSGKKVIFDKQNETVRIEENYERH